MMNNFGILNELIEGYSRDIALNNKLIIGLIVFIFINLVTTVINIYSQHHLKNKDRKNISFKIKEEKRIMVFESIYKALDRMTFFMGKDDAENLLKSIQEIEKNISANKIYIGKKELKLMYEATDYFKTVASDYRKKDFSTENTIFNKLSDSFN